MIFHRYFEETLARLLKKKKKKVELKIENEKRKNQRWPEIKQSLKGLSSQI